MKLKCKEVHWGFEELFEKDQEYIVLKISPNGKAVEILCCGEVTFVALKNSIFGVFEVIQ